MPLLIGQENLATMLMGVTIVTALCIGFVLWVNVGRHEWMLREAKRTLKRISREKDPKVREKIIGGTHHFVFEELVLLQLKRKGASIVRNTRYTGDGGIDGQYRYKRNQAWCVVQAKRYGEDQSIKLSDVKKFEQLCQRRRTSGLFITTGKSSANIDRIFEQSSAMCLVDKRKLLEFFS